ncbi:putative N-acetyltransferase HLS1 [Tasmannia lanceolata]|uniref:putative N-acetyltransferase HLS1 n=1 Tax=Tasmannia lanceolata TaxID=3420 RepID=UPI004062BB07
MDVYIENKVLIREFNEERDLVEVERVERNCEIECRKGFSFLTNIMCDPLCRIRLYPTRIMLVAELIGSGELVGVVRGCMKCVGTGSGETRVKIGCILGLRVSSMHRHKGIGLKLVKSIEGWAIRNGAQYICLATEENNVASTNLFILKCNYVKLSSLVILVQSIESRAKTPHRDVKIEKLSVDQAISLYKDRLGGKVFFPIDIDTILREKLNLGTWVSFFKGEEWANLHCTDKNEDFNIETPSSWAILSIWKTYEAYKLQIRGTPFIGRFDAKVRHTGAQIFPCLRIPSVCDQPSRPFGFLFLYGLHGEGERMGVLMKHLWRFAYNLAGKVKDCRAIITELGACDPIRGHIPQGPSMSCINDLWCLKRVHDSSNGDDDWTKIQTLTHLFVDPREF